jgi:hypothetical protein
VEDATKARSSPSIGGAEAADSTGPGSLAASMSPLVRNAGERLTEVGTLWLESDRPAGSIARLIRACYGPRHLTRGDFGALLNHRSRLRRRLRCPSTCEQGIRGPFRVAGAPLPGMHA